jgi:hypothetical protein
MIQRGKIVGFSDHWENMEQHITANELKRKSEFASDYQLGTISKATASFIFWPRKAQDSKSKVYITVIFKDIQRNPICPAFCPCLRI